MFFLPSLRASFSFYKFLALKKSEKEPAIIITLRQLKKSLSCISSSLFQMHTIIIIIPIKIILTTSSPSRQYKMSAKKSTEPAWHFLWKKIGCRKHPNVVNLWVSTGSGQKVIIFMKTTYLLLLLTTNMLPLEFSFNVFKGSSSFKKSPRQNEEVMKHKSACVYSPSSLVLRSAICISLRDTMEEAETRSSNINVATFYEEKKKY